MSKYDSPWKEALDRYFERFLAFFFPQAHADIDWPRGYEFLDKELQQIAPEGDLGGRVVDKLAKVWLRSGAEEWLLIHIEVQSQVDAGFPRRMFVYNYRTFDKYNREVVSLAILGDDRPGWRPGGFGYGRWGCRVGIDFPAVKLLDYAQVAPALETDPNPFAVLVLAHLKTLETQKDPSSRQLWKVRIVKGLYERGFSKADVQQLFRFIDWMMELPHALKGLFWQEIEQHQKEKAMPYISTPEQLAREAVRLEGLEVALEVKFGPEGLKLLPELRELDHEQLRVVLQAVKTAKAPEELRTLWTK
jgi:hypothetical protein